MKPNDSDFRLHFSDDLEVEISDVVPCIPLVDACTMS